MTFFLVFEDENLEVEQNNDLIVNYNTNYCYPEDNDFTEHPDSVFCDRLSLILPGLGALHV